MNVLRQKTWSPYVAGALAGLLLVLSVFLTGKYMGASTTFVRAAVLSTFMCKFHIGQFFKEWQVYTHFSDRV